MRPTTMSRSSRSGGAYRAEFLKRDAAIAVLVGIDDRFVHNLQNSQAARQSDTHTHTRARAHTRTHTHTHTHTAADPHPNACAPPSLCTVRGAANLLELRVLEVVADHEFEHLEQLTVGDEAVAVNVVDLERNCAATNAQRQRERESVCV